MSEYQHYEFHTVGRRLSGKARTQVRALSSHITVNSSSAWIDYHWGDFKHDPLKVLEKYFDVFVYDSNWGSQQLAFRWDAGSVDFEELKRFAVDEIITVSKKKESIFFHAAFDENIQDYLFDGEDEDDGIRFAAFTDFVGHVQAQDERSLYLLWLKAVELAGEDASRLPPPAGMRNLNEAQKMLLRFVGVDDEILTKVRKNSEPIPKRKGKEPTNSSKGPGGKILRIKKEKRGNQRDEVEDPERENRIRMEAVVDAYGEDERALGWYYYLEDNICFPFKARIRKKRGVNPLKEGASVTVLGMADEDECGQEMFVTIETGRDGEAYDVPLDQIEPLPTAGEETLEAVLDWHYWKARGYLF